MIAELPPPPEWLRGCSLVAIGGWNSIFGTTLRALRMLVQPSTTEGEGGTFTAEEARIALAACTAKPDDVLRPVSGLSKDSEIPSYVVPKIALCVAVINHLDLKSVNYVPATGSGAGLMALGEFAPLA